MTVGAHLRNEDKLQSADTTLFHTMRGKVVTAFWYQDPSAVIALAGGPDKVICRLPNSFDNGQAHGLDALIRDYQDNLNKWYASGVRLFVLDNEPNDSWKGVTPPAGKTVQWLWAWLMRRVLRGLAIPDDATLLLTPMSEPTNYKEWVEEMYVREKGFPSIADYCGAAAAHCYWQAEADMDSDWAGRSYQYIHQRTGFDVYITEAGCSTTHDTENRQAHDYPIYCDKVAVDTYVKGITFFILGSNGNWTLFSLTSRVCAAIANRKTT